MGVSINARVFVGLEVRVVNRPSRLVTKPAGFLACDCATLIHFSSLYNIVAPCLHFVSPGDCQENCCC